MSIEINRYIVKVNLIFFITIKRGSYIATKNNLSLPFIPIKVDEGRVIIVS